MEVQLWVDDTFELLFSISRSNFAIFGSTFFTPSMTFLEFLNEYWIFAILFGLFIQVKILTVLDRSTSKSILKTFARVLGIEKVPVTDKNIKEYEKEIIKKLIEIREGRVGSSAEITKLVNRETELRSSFQALEETVRKLKNENDLLLNRANELADERSTLLNIIQEKDELSKDFAFLNHNSIAKLSNLISDYQTVQYSISEKYLRSKSHPALVEAKRIDELRVETKAYIKTYKEIIYKWEYLLAVFPELADYAEDIGSIRLEVSPSFKNALPDNVDIDNVKNFLSKQEYDSMSVDDRNQLALDRYLSGSKSNWQIGRDYELFCGWEYEQNGWDVTYTGMEKKLEDLGRDLISVKGRKVNVIQCKYWSRTKMIHEKHVLQIFGTALLYQLDNKDKEVKPVLITNTNLSQTALEFARKLNVEIVTKPIRNFPRIKCNVSKDEFGITTRIYHLPFDQQYDKTRIKNNGEFYAYTVKEAVEAGFRRAYKYQGG